jgi:RNA polymerase sigma-70 factor, ECF subfamily
LLSDTEIIRRVQNGRTQEFRRLIERYQGKVFLLCLRILGRREEAEDASQDAFVRVFQSLGTFNQDSPFWPWARRIAVNCCLRKLPREFPSDRVDDAIESTQPFVDPVEAEFFNSCDRESMDKAVSCLPDQYRVVVAMRYLEDCSTKEIAELLGETPGAVRVRLHRALKMLSERLTVMKDEYGL